MRACRIAAVMILLCLSLARAAPLFPDVAEGHWAQEAVRALAAKGLLEGYPDGTFKGDRAASRFELAVMVARLLARMEREHLTFASEQDRQAVLSLAQAMRTELEAFGVRISQTEEQVQGLDKRVDELSRIRFYGSLESVVVSQQLHGAQAIGTSANSGIDWSSGRLLLNGKGLSGFGMLGFNAKIDPELTAGAEFVAYHSQGNLSVDSYWGATAPWLANPWTTPHGVTSGSNDNNTPFTRMVLDNFWISHLPSHTRATLGSFSPERVAPFVFLGAHNPNINPPLYLPMYGLDVKGDAGDSGLKYEAFYTLLPELAQYGTRSLGTALTYDLESGRGSVRLTAVRTYNEQNNSDGLSVQAGEVRLPSTPFTGPGAAPLISHAWLGASGQPSAVVGPQQEDTFGLDLNYAVLREPKLSLFGEFAASNYNPDVTHTLFNTQASGTLFRAGVRAEPVGGLALTLEYLRVAPTYDPFIAQYPQPPATPTFLPFGAYYSNYYQLHDYLNYPDNRQGLRFAGEYRFNSERTRVHLELTALDQVAPTTPGQVVTVGNIEPLFSVLQAGARDVGRIRSLGLGVAHEFDNGLRLSVDYNRYRLLRPGLPINDIALTQDVASLQAAYPIDRFFTLRAGYYMLDYRGYTGVVSTSFSQQIPGIGLNIKAAERTSLSLDYRLFALRDRVTPSADYDGGQLMMAMRVDF